MSEISSNAPANARHAALASDPKPPEFDEWLWLPQVAELLGVRGRDVRAMLRDRQLVAVRRGDNNALAVNGGQFVAKDGAIVPLPPLRGTLISLADAGYSDEEALRWLLTPNDHLGDTATGEAVTPLAGLRGEKTHAVRRAIQFLAF